MNALAQQIAQLNSAVSQLAALQQQQLTRQEPGRTPTERKATRAPVITADAKATPASMRQSIPNSQDLEQLQIEYQQKIVAQQAALQAEYEQKCRELQRMQSQFNDNLVRREEFVRPENAAAPASNARRDGANSYAPATHRVNGAAGENARAPMVTEPMDAETTFDDWSDEAFRSLSGITTPDIQRVVEVNSGTTRMPSQSVVRSTPVSSRSESDDVGRATVSTLPLQEEKPGLIARFLRRGR